MPNFPLSTARYDYRPLKEGVSGWDVYAFQTALNVFAEPDIALDGYFGPRTHEATVRFQRNRDLEPDGIAGTDTLGTAVRRILPRFTEEYDLPKNGLKGGVEKESGNIPGNHTAQYADGSYDLGLTQINNFQKGVTFTQAFDVLFAVDFYAATVRENFDRYSSNDPSRLTRLQQRGISNTLLSTQRRWELAFGSWNRPAHTAWLAGQHKGETQESITGPLTQAQRDWIEGYIDRVCSYIQWS